MSNRKIKRTKRINNFLSRRQQENNWQEKVWGYADNQYKIHMFSNEQKQLYLENNKVANVIAAIFEIELDYYNDPADEKINKARELIDNRIADMIKFLKENNLT